jgi:hypothetical protein
MIVVISCGAKKRTTPSRAIDLYDGSYFKAARNWARSVTTDNRIFIMSAKYGLLPANKVVHPYNLRMGQAGSVTVGILRQQARALLIDREVAIVVAGGAYANMARQVWTDIRTPFAAQPHGVLYPGKSGMGYQLQAMKQHLGRLPATSPMQTPDQP